MKQLLALLFTVGLMNAPLRAQPNGQPTPPPAPSTAPAPRRSVVIPPGFSVVTVGPRRVICEPANEAWVRAQLEQISPTTLPTTMPSDLVSRLSARRDLLKVRVSSDLALQDNAAVDKLLNDTLVKKINLIDAIDPPIFMLVCSASKLKELVRNGWDEPRFHYNRVAEEVAYDPDLRLTEDRPMDDVVLPAIYREDAADEATKRARLVEEIQRNESGIADAISKRAMIVTQLAFMEFIHKNAIEPLQLKDDQVWFAVGVEAVLSAHYMSELTGLNLDALLERITRDNPRNPIRSATIDLLHPSDRTTMKPQWVPVYDDAYRAKATRVVAEWSKNSGDGAIAMVLSAMRRKTPPDGAGLLNLIKVTTNADLAEATKAK